MLTSIDGFLRYFGGVHRRAMRDVAALPPQADGWRPSQGEGEKAWSINGIVGHMAGSRLYFASAYRGEGWGLCHDGKRFVMSDGSATLTFRDSESFAVVGAVEVTAAGRPLPALNELECVDGAVYANVFGQDFLVRIDPATGQVTAWIDASGLLDPEEAAEADVLNGIAYNPETGRFYITGKLWPWMFEATFQ